MFEYPDEHYLKNKTSRTLRVCILFAYNRAIFSVIEKQEKLKVVSSEINLFSCSCSQ